MATTSDLLEIPNLRQKATTAWQRTLASWCLGLEPPADRYLPPRYRALFLAYGLAARIPVALVMLVAIFADWGTHYEKGPPHFPEMGALAKWFWIGLLPQMTLWIAFTVLVGTLVGCLAALAARWRGKPATA